MFTLWRLDSYLASVITVLILAYLVFILVRSGILQMIELYRVLKKHIALKISKIKSAFELHMDP